MKKRTPPEVSRANQVAFKELLSRNRITLLQAAKGIAHVTKRPCAYRTVKSWMADPELTIHARPCPSWAVSALREWIVDHVG